MDICLVDMENLDKKPAARKDPIKDTITLKSPIKGSYLGKRLCKSESGITDMIPVVRETLTITENPFNPEPLTENPIVTELDLIGQLGPWAVIGGTHTQSISHGGGSMIHEDVISHILMNLNQVSLKSNSFLFNPEQAQTLMITSLIEVLLSSDGDIHTGSIL